MTTSIAADELRLLIERIERLEEEKKAISDDIKDVYAEAKARGFDPPTMKECVKLRKLDPSKLQERDALIETYRAALGMDGGDTGLRQAIDNFERSTAGTAVTMSVAGGPEVPMNQAARDADQLYTRAVEAVIGNGNASTSWLQRHLGIANSQAAGLLERMERAGVVSAPDGAGARRVLARDKAA
jgi:uncharacterized protein (UPF0335 family)